MTLSEATPAIIAQLFPYLVDRLTRNAQGIRIRLEHDSAGRGPLHAASAVSGRLDFAGESADRPDRESPPERFRKAVIRTVSHLLVGSSACAKQQPQQFVGP